MTTAERMNELFSGLERAYGTYKIGETLESGKQVAKPGGARTKKAAVTLELWQSHLDGKEAIGIVPIRDDSTCSFGAIDIDFYTDFDVPALARKIHSLNLPLNVCLSKSGGAHLYLFSAEPVSAGLMQDRLREMAKIIGFETVGSSAVEIFPKQREILVERGDIGGWINMPWFNEARTTRYALSPAGERLTIDEFLDWAESRKQALEFFSIPIRLADEGHDRFPDGPPCLQRLVTIKIGEGARNNGFVNVVTYLKKASPEDWRERVKGYGDMFDPPLDYAEMKATIRTGGRKHYDYMCKKEPIVSVCDSAVCRGRKFGVGKQKEEELETEHGDGPPPFPTIGQLRKLLVEPPIWFLDVNDRSVELTTEQLQSPRLFQKRCMEAVNFMTPIPTDTSWQRMIQDLMSRVVDIEAPEDSSPEGMFWEFLNQFCTVRGQARANDEVINGRPWNERGYTWFRMHSLSAFLERNHFKDFPSQKITSALKKRGALHEEWTLRGKIYSVWGVPQFRTPEEKIVDESKETAF